MCLTLPKRGNIVQLAHALEVWPANLLDSVIGVPFYKAPPFANPAGMLCPFDACNVKY